MRKLDIPVMAACFVLGALLIGGAAFVAGRSASPSEVRLDDARAQGRTEAFKTASARAFPGVAQVGVATGQTLGRTDGRHQGRRDGLRQAKQDVEAEQQAVAARIAAQQVILDCPVAGPEVNFANLSVRNMNCSTAVSLVGSITTMDAYFTVGGFSCSRISGGDLGGQWRCTQGNEAFRFDWGD